jgi:exodeoxyribonuclease VII large subunit
MAVISPPPGVKVLTVSELTLAVKELLETEHPCVYVEGEVSNLARPASGHLYLTLKDDQSPIRAVLYRGIALRLRYDLRDGMHVIVRGRLTVYAPRGEYQLLIEEVQPKGIGPLELAFRQLKEKLSARGYFELARKKALPGFPRRIGLVTSPTGSAVRDMLEVLAQRWPGVEVWVCPVHVQGDEAAPEIATAIGYLNQVGRPDGDTPIDVLILARGGGSLEDLWPFNEEIVAHAIDRSRLPIVTGIGHEDDLTIADLVADRRALTPTEAASLVVPDRLDLQTAVERLAGKLRTNLVQRAQLARTRLDQLSARPCLRRPLDRLRHEERRIDDLGQRLQRAMTHHLERARVRLRSITDILEGLSPLKILARGYSLTYRLDDLALIRSARQIGKGDWILTRIHGGKLVSRVESITEELTNQGKVNDEE